LVVFEYLHFRFDKAQLAVYSDPAGLNPPAAVGDNGAVTVSGWSFDALGDVDFQGDLLAKAVSLQVSPFGD
jgi:hypothetical protein